VADAKILNVPIGLSPELMAVIRSDFADAKRKLFDDVIDEVDGIGLGVLFIDT